MPIKCIQRLHLWGSIQHWYGCCLGTFKGQTRKQHRNPCVESHLLYWGISLGPPRPPQCEEGWGWPGAQEAPLALCCWREGACALFGGLAGGLGVVGCHPEDRLRWWGGVEAVSPWTGQDDVQGTSQDCSDLFWLVFQGRCPGPVAKDSGSFQMPPGWQGSAPQPPGLLLSWLCVC